MEETGLLKVVLLRSQNIDIFKDIFKEQEDLVVLLIMYLQEMLMV